MRLVVDLKMHGLEVADIKTKPPETHTQLTEIPCLGNQHPPNLPDNRGVTTNT